MTISKITSIQDKVYWLQKIKNNQYAKLKIIVNEIDKDNS